MEKYRHLFLELEEGLLRELQEKGRVLEVKAGKSLIQSGQNIRQTIIVLDGLVKLYRENNEGDEFFMYHLHPGDGCALSLICDRTFRPRRAWPPAPASGSLGRPYRQFLDARDSQSPGRRIAARLGRRHGVPQQIGLRPVDICSGPNRYGSLNSV